MTVADEIARLAELHRAKQVEYGQTDVRSGDVFLSIFPGGVRLETRADFARFSIFVHIVDKICRYATNFNRGGHEDSLRDVAVYSMMLREIDACPLDRLRDDRPSSESDGGGRVASEDDRISRLPERLVPRRFDGRE